MILDQHILKLIKSDRGLNAPQVGQQWISNRYLELASEERNVTFDWIQNAAAVEVVLPVLSEDVKSFAVVFELLIDVLWELLEGVNKRLDDGVIDFDLFDWLDVFRFRLVAVRRLTKECYRAENNEHCD